MKHYEINLTVKDVQILSGFAYNASKILLQKIKKLNGMKPQHWISLNTFCLYCNINYYQGLAVLDANHKC